MRHTAAMPDFASLGVAVPVIDRLAARSIVQPTPVQTRVIPLIAAGRDVAFRSATGTGKTLAYLLPVYAAYPGQASSSPYALVAAPTYELCAQIKGEWEELADGPKAALLTGDANMTRQIDRLKSDKPAVAIGTPGRLIQLIRMGKLKTAGLRYLVLDEADRLVAPEALDATVELVGRLPADRVTIACSATLPPKARSGFRAFLKPDASLIELDDASVLREFIEHWAVFSEGRRKIATLRSLLLAAKPEKVLVFTDRTGQVGNILGQLKHHGFAAVGLSGDLDKVARKQAIDTFRSGKATVMVTSDLSARGLDIVGISHVVALDVPQTGEAYAHRAGRTARAGKRGIMVTIGDAVEMPHLAALEKRLKIRVNPKAIYGGQIREPGPVDEDAVDVGESPAWEAREN
jgi:superfamily II DNA/RNA helicase